MNSRSQLISTILRVLFVPVLFFAFVVTLGVTACTNDAEPTPEASPTQEPSPSPVLWTEQDAINHLVDDLEGELPPWGTEGWTAEAMAEGEWVVNTGSAEYLVLEDGRPSVIMRAFPTPTPSPTATPHSSGLTVHSLRCTDMPPDYFGPGNPPIRYLSLNAQLSNASLSDIRLKDSEDGGLVIARYFNEAGELVLSADGSIDETVLESGEYYATSVNLEDPGMDTPDTCRLVVVSEDGEELALVGEVSAEVRIPRIRIRVPDRPLVDSLRCEDFHPGAFNPDGPNRFLTMTGRISNPSDMDVQLAEAENGGGLIIAEYLNASGEVVLSVEGSLETAVIGEDNYHFEIQQADPALDSAETCRVVLVGEDGSPIDYYGTGVAEVEEIFAP